jgi:hypothetical protein
MKELVENKHILNSFISVVQFINKINERCSSANLAIAVNIKYEYKIIF